MSEPCRGEVPLHRSPAFSLGCVLPLTRLGVPPLVGDPVDGVQQLLLVAVRVQLELGPSVVAELGHGHLLPGGGGVNRLLQITKQYFHTWSGYTQFHSSGHMVTAKVSHLDHNYNPLTALRLCRVESCCAATEASLVLQRELRITGGSGDM